MLSPNDLRKGILFIYNDQPYEVFEYSSSVKGRGSSVIQTKIKNLVTGNITSHNFKPSETFEEAELENVKLSFVYSNRGKHVFQNLEDKSQRVELTEEQVGESIIFLKTNQEVLGIKFNDKIINISIPIKVELKVTEAPPFLRAGRSDAGTKQVTVETGAKINTPVFVEEGDIIEINTQTKEYVRRVE